MSNTDTDDIKSINTTLTNLFNEFRRYQTDQLIQHNQRRKAEHPNPITRCGQQLFSQSDEDGVTIEILRRMGMLKGHHYNPYRFAEIGVENGTQCNTLVLAAMGWEGVWYDQVELGYEIPNPERLKHVKTRVTRRDVYDLLTEEVDKNRMPLPIDVLSVDVDGTDYHLCQALLHEPAEYIRPALVIVEYNADFPPPVPFVQDYSDDYQWDHSNYYGASLQSLSDLFGRSGYRLVACNAASGCNAFFVRGDMFKNGMFDDVPRDIRDIYVPPHYQLDVKFSHGPSLETVKRVLR